MKRCRASAFLLPGGERRLHAPGLPWAPEMPCVRTRRAVSCARPCSRSYTACVVRSANERRCVDPDADKSYCATCPLGVDAGGKPIGTATSRNTASGKCEAFTASTIAGCFCVQVNAYPRTPCV